MNRHVVTWCIEDGSDNTSSRVVSDGEEVMGMNIRSHIAWKRALSGGRGEQSPEPGRDGEGAGAGGRPHPGDSQKGGGGFTRNQFREISNFPSFAPL